MNTITLNNDIQMPMLGFGTFLMGGAECEESVLTALRQWIPHARYGIGVWE